MAPKQATPTNGRTVPEDLPVGLAGTTPSTSSSAIYYQQVSGKNMPVH